MEYSTTPLSSGKLSLDGRSGSLRDEISKPARARASEPKGFVRRAWAKLSEGASLEGHGVVPLRVEERT